MSCSNTGRFHGGQERHDRVGDRAGGAPGKVMTGAVDVLQAGVRKRVREPAGGGEGNLGVLRVGEEEYRRPDRRDG
jgi:hypothetical protein